MSADRAGLCALARRLRRDRSTAPAPAGFAMIGQLEAMAIAAIILLVAWVVEAWLEG
ncbi:MULTISPECIES: hypothetical protein [Bradyrhizobium]|uniref:hypothetical protein n=1 Tax=Bradyrhizobium TaxID=374 RepID=UPI001BAA977C|nr:hypothetical protein [Bradyrhizobium liaoningense]MBR1026840.1 hypothetical protein [Bradyrhizobium liaoningense]